MRTVRAGWVLGLAAAAWLTAAVAARAEGAAPGAPAPGGAGPAAAVPETGPAAPAPAVAPPAEKAPGEAPGGEGKAGEQAPAGRPWDLFYPPPQPQPDDIFHVATGLKVSFDGMMDVLSAARVVYVGEAHDNVHAHRVELAVIEDLERRFPGKVAIGMEMFREPQQEAVDRWVRGELSETEFLKVSRWYDTWGSDYGYYRAILAFAQRKGIDVVALNPSKELQEEVSTKGLDNLPPELKAKLPEMGEPDPYQRESMKAVFGAHKATEGMVDSFLRVQSLWEETMAERAVAYLKGPRGEGKRLVVLAGGWHVRYGFGIPKKVFRRTPLPYAILLPTELSVPEEKQDELMDVDLPAIPLAPADFLWMVPYEDLEKEGVRLGVILSDKDGRVTIQGVQEGYPAEKAGVEKGSELVSFDGQPVTGIGEVQLLVRQKRPGDRATIVTRKDGTERTFTMELYHVNEKKKAKPAEPEQKEQPGERKPAP